MQEESTLPIEGQPGGEPADTPVAVPTPEIAGFWIRLCSYLIDALLLGTVGSVLGWLMFDSLARMGGYERLIGLALVMGYAAVLNSRIGGGQTLGKRLLGARVVRVDGSLLSLPRSLARQSILATPFFLNFLGVGQESLLASSVLALLVFGGFAATTYLLIFNRQTRQLPHDLAVGSYVARVRPAGAGALSTQVWRPHLLIAAALVLLSLALPSIALRLASGLGYAQPLAEMTAALSELSKLPGVQTYSITDGWTQQAGGPRTTYVAVSLKLATPRIDDPKLAGQAAALVRAKYPAATQRDGITVTLFTGFDMVIASGTRTKRFEFPN